MLMKKVIFLSFVSCFLFLVSSEPALAQSVDLLWQGETYTPPFYQGKSLWSKQTSLTFVAIPQGLGNPSNLNYQWTRNGTVLGLISGVGKNSMVYRDNIFSKPVSVKVEIVDADENVLASASTLLRPVETDLMVYEDHPLYGFMFHRAIGEAFKLSKDEVTFAAFPYFSDVASRLEEGLVYKWSSNSAEDQRGPSAVYRIPEKEKGSALVGIRFNDPELVLTDIGRSFLVQFGDE